MFAETADKYLEDGIHLSAEGRRVYGDILGKMIAKDTPDNLVNMIKGTSAIHMVVKGNEDIIKEINKKIIVSLGLL